MQNRLSEEWVQSCLDIWSLSRNRYIDRDKLTLWDAFRFLYLKKTDDGGSGKSANRRKIIKDEV